MWIATEAEEKVNASIIEHWDDDPITSLCTKVARHWTPRCVATFLLECCSERGVSASEKQVIANAIRVVLESRIGGLEFTSMTLEELVIVLGMSRSFAKYFYERFMYWVHICMDNPPDGAQIKLEKMICEMPGGGMVNPNKS